MRASARPYRRRVADLTRRPRPGRLRRDAALSASLCVQRTAGHLQSRRGPATGHTAPMSRSHLDPGTTAAIGGRSALAVILPVLIALALLLL
jgi:hypothetical protein